VRTLRAAVGFCTIPTKEPHGAAAGSKSQAPKKLQGSSSKREDASVQQGGANIGRALSITVTAQGYLDAISDAL